MFDARNLTMVMDFYELTMSQVYFSDNNDEIGVFDLFYRRNPEDGGFSIFAGLDQIIDYVQNLHFDE